MRLGQNVLRLQIVKLLLVHMRMPVQVYAHTRPLGLLYNVDFVSSLWRTIRFFSSAINPHTSSSSSSSLLEFGFHKHSSTHTHINIHTKIWTSRKSVSGASLFAATNLKIQQETKPKPRKYDRWEEPRRGNKRGNLTLVLWEAVIKIQEGLTESLWNLQRVVASFY